MAHAPWAHNTIFRLSILGTCQGQVIANVLHFEATQLHEDTLISDALAQTSSLNLANDWNTNLKTSWLACHTTDYTLVSVRGQVVERLGFKDKQLIAAEASGGLPAVGTAAGNIDDMTTSAVIKWKSLTAGRHSRGRTYIGPLSDGVTDKGLISSPTNFTTWANAMISRYTGTGPGVVAGWNFTVYSRPYDAPNGAYTVRVPGSGLTVVNNTTDYNGNSTFILSGQIDLTARTQRRRELGVGS